MELQVQYVIVRVDNVFADYRCLIFLAGRELALDQILHQEVVSLQSDDILLDHDRNFIRILNFVLIRYDLSQVADRHRLLIIDREFQI